MTTFATTTHTTSAAAEAWDALTHQLDLVTELRTTRDAWASQGRDDLVPDANNALGYALAQVAPLNASYERALMGA